MFAPIIIFSAVVQGLVALFVLLKNPKYLTNILFFLLSMALVGWAVLNYLLTNATISSGQIYLFRSLMSAVVVQNILFILFSYSYPNDKLNINHKKLILYICLSVIAFSVTLSPIMFVKLEYSSGAPRPVSGPGMLIFIIHAGVSVFFGLRILISKIKKSQGFKKHQLKLIFAGSIILWGVVPITNFVFSIATKTLFFAKISPIYTLAFSSIIAYAIITQKLFDIRAAVARSVAYILSLGFIGFIYGSVIYLISTVFNFDELSNNAQRVIYVFLAIVTAVFYPTVKKFFARITTRIFYQDAYDPQVFLDSLNKILVSRVDIEPLLKDISDVIEENIKAEYCVFTLRESAYYPARTIGTKNKQFSDEDAIVLHNLTPKIHHKVLITDELGEEQTDLKSVLSKYNVSVLARLVSTVKLDVEGIGYLVLGPKKSGNIYSKQDEDIIRIIANELVIAIENALKFEEIQKFNETLQEKIETATRQLRTTNEKLKLLDETKDEFISMASHQLRTPLTSVKGYLSMVLEGDAGDVSEMQHKLLNQAFVSSQRMVYLIADLLNVSRLRTGKFIIEPIATNLAEVVEGESSQLKITATGKDLSLNFKKPENFPSYMLDETKIRQVIMNFMDNAIYYTPKGGEINVELKETEKTIEYTVSDNGIGVPKSELHHLFTKFYRAGNAKKTRPDGTGLGLFMAKKVIVAQGGSVILKSEEGKGSTFGFEFDKSKLQLAPPAES